MASDAPAGDPTSQDRDQVDDALAGDASRPVVRGAAVRGLTYGVSTALIALAFLVVFRDLGVAAFGRLSAAVAVAAIVQSLGDTAVSAVAQRLLVAAPAVDRPRLAAELVGLRLVLMPLASCVGVAFAVVAGYPTDQVLAVVVACLGATLAVTAAAWTTPLVIELRAARASVAEFARQVVIAVGLVSAALVGASLTGYALAYAVAGLVAVAVSLALVDRQWRRLARPRGSTVRAVAAQAAWLALAITVSSLFLKVLTVVASVATDEVETGLFATASRVIEVIAGLPLLMAAVAFPLLSRAADQGDTARLAHALDRVLRGVLLLIGGVVVITVVAAEPIIVVFAGADFAPAAGVLQLQAFALLASTATQALVWVLVALRAEKLLVVANLLGLVLLLVLGSVLMSAFGARGGAVAAIVGEVVMVLVTLLVLRRVRRAAVPALRPLVTLVAVTLVAALVGLVLPWPPVVGAIAAAALFGVLVLALRLVPDELWAVLRRRSPVPR